MDLLFVDKYEVFQEVVATLRKIDSTLDNPELDRRRKAMVWALAPKVTVELEFEKLEQHLEIVLCFCVVLFELSLTLTKSQRKAIVEGARKRIAQAIADGFDEVKPFIVPKNPRDPDNEGWGW